MTAHCRTISLLSIAAISLITTGCEQKAPATTAAPPPVVTVSKPLDRDVTDYEDFTGRVQAMESVDIRARVGGYLEQITFQPGADVQKDEVLFQIDPRPFKAILDQAKAQLAQSQASLKEQEIEVSRITELLKTQAATPIESDRTLAQRDATRASVEANKANVEQAQLNLDYTTVKAPITGRISRNYVDVGNLIMGGQTAQQTLLTTIMSMDPIYAYFDVDEETVLRVRKRILGGEMKSYKDINIPLWLGLASEEGFPHEGKIDFVENHLNSDTGTLNVRGIFNNHGSGVVRMLSPGMFARIRLQVGAPYRALLVPESALNSDQGQRFLLVVNDKKAVESRPVKIGRQHGRLRVIESGIRADEWYITNGLQRVRPGLTVDPRRQALETQPIASEPASQPRNRPGSQSE